MPNGLLAEPDDPNFSYMLHHQRMEEARAAAAARAKNKKNKARREKRKRNAAEGYVNHPKNIAKREAEAFMHFDAEAMAARLGAPVQIPGYNYHVEPTGNIVIAPPPPPVPHDRGA